MVHALVVANYFVSKSLATGKELTPQKLIKLVYLAHAWHMALKGEPLLSEGIQAWKYGPVVSSVYYQFLHYGNSQITELYFDATTSTYPIVKEKSLKLFLDDVWNLYGEYSGLVLSSNTNQTNSPWDIAWNAQGRRKKEGIIIPNDLISKYYQEKANGQKTRHLA